MGVWHFLTMQKKLKELLLHSASCVRQSGAIAHAMSTLPTSMPVFQIMHRITGKFGDWDIGIAKIEICQHFTCNSRHTFLCCACVTRGFGAK